MSGHRHLAILLLSLFGAVGCRGDKSASPPIHLQQNMDFQRRFDPQEENPFYGDGRAMRMPVPGTIARGHLHADDYYDRGMQAGKLARDLPPSIHLDRQLIARGRARFGIYCAPCHGGAGDGNSVMKRRNIAVPPPSYMEQRLRAQPLGYFFDVITRGVRSMRSYATQIPVRDRWAIATYVRVLQLAGSATIDQVPAAVTASKGWGRK